MSNRDEIDAIVMLARAMGGEKNVIEHMEAEGQQQACKCSYVAREMYPNRYAWERLGFVFTDIPNDCVLCKAILPEGWSIQPTEHSMWNNILDEKGRKRASMFYKAAFYDRDANMRLRCRYGVRSNYIDDEHTTSEIYFGNENEKLFVAGQIHIDENLSWEEKRPLYNKEDKLRDAAEAFGKENYPEYEDPLAYWDEEKELSKDPQRSKKQEK